MYIYAGVVLTAPAGTCCGGGEGAAPLRLVREGEDPRHGGDGEGPGGPVAVPRRVVGNRGQRRREAGCGGSEVAGTKSKIPVCHEPYPHSSARGEFKNMFKKLNLSAKRT